MSMLAGPRRKQKVINLRAKNNAWSNDSSKFGQRMLEKMGWSEGKGLGSKENGIVEHVVARYKNDEKGLGFEDKNDQWTKHEDDFNALLTNLSNGDGNDEKLHSGVSLEVKSKKSKTRVHYHKFTRGKDISRYSEKDLANIFGKKSLKNEEKVLDVLEEEEKNSERVFTDKGSMDDYFKNKLAALKSKNKMTILHNVQYSNEEDNDYAFKGFSGTMNSNPESEEENTCSFQAFSFYSNGKSNADIDIHSQEQDSEVKEKNKKKKKSKHSEKIIEHVYDDQSVENINNQGEEFEQIIEMEIVDKPKKSKKKKKQELSPPLVVEKDVILVENHAEDVPVNNEMEKDDKPKKSKKKKRKDLSSPLLEEREDLDIALVPKKKKKRKNKNGDI